MTNCLYSYAKSCFNSFYNNIKSSKFHSVSFNADSMNKDMYVNAYCKKNILNKLIYLQTKNLWLVFTCHISLKMSLD